MKTIDRKISQLRSAEYNSRTMSPKEFTALRQSIEKFGVVEPIVINVNPKRMNVVIGGHQRLQVCQKLGHITIPCFAVNLTLKRERELNIRLNRNTGDWNWEALTENFTKEELAGWGFDQQEIGLAKGEAIQFETEALRAYRRTHILLSFPPTQFVKVQGFIEALSKIEGMEIEQASN